MSSSGNSSSGGSGPGFYTVGHELGCGHDGVVLLSRRNSTAALENADTYALYATFAHLQCSKVTGLMDRRGGMSITAQRLGKT